RVLLVAPQAPPYGGMGVQAEMMLRLMREESVAVTLLPSNPQFPTWLRIFARIPGVRTMLRCAIFCRQLWQQLANVDVVHVLSCSWLYFFLVVWPTVVCGRLRGKRVILNYHGGQAEQFLRRYAALAKPAFRLASIVSTPSGFLAEVLRAHTGVRVEIVPNILD